MKNGKRPVLKIRYKKPGKVFGTKFTFSKNGGRKLKGRILGIEKVSREQLLRVGEFLPFNIEELMKEFNELEKQKGGRLQWQRSQQR